MLLKLGESWKSPLSSQTNAAQIFFLSSQGSHWPGKSGKTWKKSGQESQETFFLFLRKVRDLKKKMLIVMKIKIIMIFIWKMSRLSFHALGKTSLKMSKLVREICVQVREIVRELFFRFLVWTLALKSTWTQMRNIYFSGLR